MQLVAWLVVGCLAPAGSGHGKLEEASMNFDLEDVEPLLVSVASRVQSGFSATDATNLAADIALLDVDDELTREYTVVLNGERMPLRVQAVMDDIEAPDVYFFAPARLRTVIDEAMRPYFE